MLQNRVDPLGNIITTKARGMWMGNRGVIHDEHKQIIRDFKHKAWITCVLEFKGRRRAVMTPGRWTELFFLDEATAFAAGHRPCFECRREDAKKFKLCWINGNPDHDFNMKTSVARIDEVLQTERIDPDGKKVTHQRANYDIPDGTFVLLHGNPYVARAGQLHQWTPFGYNQSIPIAEHSMLTVLTPKSIVNAFLAGYVPQISLP